MNDEQILEGVQRWLQDVVIGLDLCPFAAKPVSDGTLGLEISRAETAKDLYTDLVSAIDRFLRADPSKRSTVLYICPNAVADFVEYNDLLVDLQDGLAETGLVELIQVVGFHPGYRFDGADPDDPANYTNRSPWPLFHLIRQEEMAVALDHHPDPDAIPERNIALLQSIGLHAMRERLRSYQQNEQ